MNGALAPEWASSKASINCEFVAPLLHTVKTERDTPVLALVPVNAEVPKFHVYVIVPAPVLCCHSTVARMQLVVLIVPPGTEKLYTLTEEPVPVIAVCGPELASNPEATEHVEPKVQVCPLTVVAEFVSPALFSVPPTAKVRLPLDGFE